VKIALLPSIAITTQKEITTYKEIIREKICGRL
jgi:hypothetical protein